MAKLSCILGSTKIRLRALFIRKDDSEEPAPNPAGRVELRSFSRFEQLPFEIMHEIAGYLTLDDWACLICTSHYFRSFFCGIDFSMKDFVGLGAAKYCGTPEELDNFQWLNEKDNPPDVTNPKARAYCSKCGKLISIKHFRHDPFECDRRKRQCLGHEGSIWYCPHHRLDFEELKRLMKPSGRRNDRMEEICWDCPQKAKVLPTCDCKSCTHRGIRSYWTPTVSPRWTTLRAVTVIGRPVLNIPEGRIISTKQQLLDALKGRHFSICPHLQMSDLRVMTRFKFHRSPSQPIHLEYDTGTVLQGRCKKCDTEVEFEVFESGDRPRKQRYRYCPKRMVVMCIKHHFDHHLKPYDSQWVSVIRKPSEMASLDRQEEADLSAARALGLPRTPGNWSHSLGPFVMGRKQVDF